MLSNNRCSSGRISLALTTEYTALNTEFLRLKHIWLGRYQHDPVAFAIDHIPGIDLAEYQADELRALAEHGREAVRGPRGCGKTMPAALAFWWFVCVSEHMGVDWKAPTTAGSWDQVRTYLWPEIHKWHRELNWDKIGLDRPRRDQELLKFGLTMNFGEGFGKATNDPALIEGAHASRILMVIDEGKSVVDDIWDAGEGFFSSPGEYFMFALSTPGAPAGRFYDIHSRKAGFEDWHTTHITIEQAIAAGRVTEKWRAARENQWGADSRIYRSHVLAEFAGEEDGVIPLAWVEAAMERWKALDLNDYTATLVSVDVSDGGEDDTVLALRAGPVITKLVRPRQADLVHLAELVQNRVPVHGTAVVDSIGVGAGVLAQLSRVKGITAHGFVASERTNRKDKSGEFGFPNKRSAAWWNLREMLDPQNGEDLALPDDDLLLGDLTSPRWREAAGGKIQIESKDEIRKRLGRSTDSGDSVVMAFFDQHMGRKIHGWTPDQDLSRSSPWKV